MEVRDINKNLGDIRVWMVLKLVNLGINIDGEVKKIKDSSLRCFIV